jgi:hypothetical protein
MLYLILFCIVLGIVLASIPSKKERAYRAEVKHARDNFYLREEAKFLASSIQSARPE